METSVQTTGLLNLTGISNTAGYFYYQPQIEWNIYGYVCLLLVFVLILFVALIGNTTVLFLFIWDKSLRTPTNLFLMSIMFSDLIMTLTATPISFASTIARRWLFNDLLCHV